MAQAQGVDVSHWKPIRDAGKIYDSGVRFVGTKATEGLNYVDPTLRPHRDAMRAAPFLLNIFFHFARSGSPKRQAERLMDSVGPLRSNERLALDLEVCPTPDPRGALDWVEAFYEALLDGSSGDRRPIIYTSRRIWRSIGDPDWSLASQVDLWAPRYNDQGIEPEMPKPWLKAGWSFWQWSESAIVPGIQGACDADLFCGDEAALTAYARLRPVPSTPGPEVA